MKTSTLLTLSALALLVGCTSFRNGAPPTKTEQALFTVITNYVPSVVTVTNPPTAPGLPPVVAQVTNLTPTYTYTSGPTVGTAQAIAQAVPGYGGLISGGIGVLAAVWGWFRSSKNKDTGVTLAQSIEVIREFIKTLPNGNTYDTALTAWLQQHQAETGTVADVLNILENDVSNPDAQVAAKQLLATIKALNPQAVTPPPPPPPG